MHNRKHIKGSLILVLVIGLVLLASFISLNKNYEYFLGLDLQGGSQLIYDVDVSDAEKSEVVNLLKSLQQVIEKRVNAFGVSEPLVYTQSSSLFAKENREYLIVELPGITDTTEAARRIGETPFLEFRILDIVDNRPVYVNTNINGGHIINSSAQFITGHAGGFTNELAVVVDFNPEGKNRFAELTKKNVGEVLGIFLDGEIVSNPVINEPILGGTTQITGNFSQEEAVELVNNLNLGALPLPITLSDTQTIGASLGAQTIMYSIWAALAALGIIVLFLIFVYRVAGILAVIALFSYTMIILSIVKLTPIVLTAAGLAGLVISFGFAVDANILIFERLREELKNGVPLYSAVPTAFSKAWSSIRDANISSLIIAVILFWLGTSLIKGFAFTFAMGVVVSMFSAVFVTRIILLVFVQIFNINNKYFIPTKK